MANRDKPLSIGPFKRGLNTQSDPTDVLDDQVVEALNFDQELNGSFRSRPPFADMDMDLTLDTSGHPEMLGFYYDGSTAYLIATDGLSSTYYTTGSSWTLITDTFAASAFAQFDGKAWLVAPVGEADDGGYWTPGGGFTADEDMPKGSAIAVYKDRMYVAEGPDGSKPSAMYYSKLIVEGDIWDSYASRIVEVSPGDGQAIIRLIPYYSALLIFRSQSVYSYSFASSTAAATINILLPGVGLTDRRCVVSYENYIYFMYDDRAYEFIDNRAQQVNVTVPLRGQSYSNVARPYAVSVFNNRIIFSYYDTMFVFNQDTRTWTTWMSTTHGPIGQILSPVPGTGTADAYAFPSGTITDEGSGREAPLLRINDSISSDAEEMTCAMQTKNYNYNLSSNYKRMRWWGVDAIFRESVRGEAHPIVQRNVPTWADLWDGGYTWADLLSGFWDSPLSDPIAEVTTLDTEQLGYERKFVKFRKAMRFRQVYFRVEFTTDGSISTAPVQLFTLNVYLSTRQTVSQQVT